MKCTMMEIYLLTILTFLFSTRYLELHVDQSIVDIDELQEEEIALEQIPRFKTKKHLQPSLVARVAKSQSLSPSPTPSASYC